MSAPPRTVALAAPRSVSTAAVVVAARNTDARREPHAPLATRPPRRSWRAARAAPTRGATDPVLTVARALRARRAQLDRATSTGRVETPARARHRPCTAAACAPPGRAARSSRRCAPTTPAASPWSPALARPRDPPADGARGDLARRAHERRRHGCSPARRATRCGCGAAWPLARDRLDHRSRHPDGEPDDRRSLGRGYRPVGRHAPRRRARAGAAITDPGDVPHDALAAPPRTALALLAHNAPVALWPLALIALGWHAIAVARTPATS